MGVFYGLQNGGGEKATLYDGWDAPRMPKEATAEVRPDST
jgi:hypothetical protein